MKNFLYIHGFGSNKDSYTGNTLKQLFPQFNWTLETFDLLHVVECNQFIRQLIKEKQIDTVVSSSLGSMYNLFIKKDEDTDQIVNKILINPCCFPSRELPKIATIPPKAIEMCRAAEFNVYECHRDNTADNLFGIFAKNDELLQYHDFFAGRYGNYGLDGQVESSNCIWVEGEHHHLDKAVLADAVQQAIDYFQKVAERKQKQSQKQEEKPIVYIDLDGTLVDWESGQRRLTEMERVQYDGFTDAVPGLFSRMDPMPGGINAFYELSKKYDVYILTSAPWHNETAPSDKLRWVQKYFGIGEDSPAFKKLIISHHKDLNKGAYLIDDRPHKNGTDHFEGEIIHFGSEQFPDWETVTTYLLGR